jgi:hypothetical protein
MGRTSWPRKKRYENHPLSAAPKHVLEDDDVRQMSSKYLQKLYVVISVLLLGTFNYINSSREEARIFRIRETGSEMPLSETHVSDRHSEGGCDFNLVLDQSPASLRAQ